VATLLSSWTGRGPVFRYAVLGLACGLLLVFFMVLRFPYDKFRQPLAARLSIATGAEVTIGTLRGRPSVGLIRIDAAPLSIRWPDGRSIELTRVALRPAWSPSWLLGTPALQVDFEGLPGRLAGTVWPDAEAPAFRGRLEEVDLDALPGGAAAIAERYALQGRLGAEIDLAIGEGGADGEVRFEARDGAFAPPEAGLAIPFETLRGVLAFEPGAGARIDSIDLDGPLGGATLTGTVGPGPSLDTAPLDLEIAVRGIDPGVQAALSGLGLRMAGDGNRLLLGGTLGAPRPR
jgi:type II secretion system protein N